MTSAANERANSASSREARKDKLRLWLRLLRTTRRIEAELRERLRIEFDTTLPRFDVMSALARSNGGLTMGALSRQLLVSNGNVTGIVDRLVSDDLVMRAVLAEDRRTTVVKLTPNGARDFVRMAASHEGWVSEILSGFSEAEVSAILKMLTKADVNHKNGAEVS